MPTNTARLALQTPIGSDPPSVYRTAATANNAILDEAVLVTSGVLASRPTSGTVVGQTYYATDTGLWYFWTGAGWSTLVFAQGGQSVSVGSLTVGGTGFPVGYARGSAALLGNGSGSPQSLTVTHGLGVVPTSIVTQGFVGGLSEVAAVLLAVTGYTTSTFTVTTGGALLSGETYGFFWTAFI